jgi:hypothetical protein
VCSQWSLRNTGIYIFGAQIMLSACMFIMIGTYMIMGFLKLDTTGNGSATWGTFPYPKTAFLPFGSTVSARSLLLTVCSALLLIMIVPCVSLPPGVLAGVQFSAPASVRAASCVLSCRCCGCHVHFARTSRRNSHLLPFLARVYRRFGRCQYY